MYALSARHGGPHSSSIKKTILSWRDWLFAARRRIILCTYLQPWRGTARGLQPFGAYTATRMQLEGRNVPCKNYCVWGLQQHVVICTEDVTTARRTLQSLQISSRDTTTSSSSSNPRTSTNWLLFLILCLRRRYAATAIVTAATWHAVGIQTLL